MIAVCWRNLVVECCYFMDDCVCIGFQEKQLNLKLLWNFISSLRFMFSIELLWEGICSWCLKVWRLGGSKICFMTSECDVLYTLKRGTTKRIIFELKQLKRCQWNIFSICKIALRRWQFNFALSLSLEPNFELLGNFLTYKLIWDKYVIQQVENSREKNEGSVEAYLIPISILTE